MELELRHLPADVLGLDPLARAALAGRPRPPALGGLVVPSRLEHVDPGGAIADSPFLERDELVERLREHRASAGPDDPLHPAQERSLERLADPRSQVVLCGQQPGLLGGPLLNLYKALQTVRLAAALEERWQRPVVPLFWCHADDHDLAEIAHAHVLNRHHDVARIGLAGMGSGRRAVGDLPLDPEAQRLGPVLEGLRQLLPDGHGRDELLAASFPRAGETLATAFVRTWDRLLGHTGLVMIEPAAIREPLSRALAQLMTCDPDARLRAGLARLAAAGLASDLEPERVAWVFHHGPGGRRALRFRDGAFRFDDEPGDRNADELAARLVTEPGDWSAGALARPLVQDLCLPVAAYTGGWGELSYHAPLTELRSAASIPLTPFCVRLGATLVSPSSRFALDQLDLEIDDVLRAGGDLTEPKKDVVEHPVIAQIRAVNAARTADLAGLHGELARFDRGLGQQLKRAARQAAELVEKIARKTERVQANRRGRSNRHYRVLNNSCFGRQMHQERSLTTIQFAVTFGTEWIEALMRSIEPLPSEHLAFELPREAGSAE